MVLRGFEIELWKDTKTFDWCLFKNGEGEVFLEVYFENVNGVNIRKKVPHDSTVEDMLEKYEWLEYR